MDEEKKQNQKDQGNNPIKEGTKKAAGAAGKKIAKLIFMNPYVQAGIVLFILCILTAGVINVATYYIKNWFSSLLGFDDATKETSSSIVDKSKTIVSIGKNGEYIINNNYSEQILAELENQKVSSVAAGFIEEDSEVVDEIKDMMDKYIKAEMQTMFPKTNVLGSDMDGSIKIKRASIESGKVEDLEYISYKEWQDSGGKELLKKFSIKPDDFKLCIAEIDDNSEGGIKKRELDYQTLVQGYALPFNYLVSMHMITQDPDFMEELIDESTKKDIVLTFVDSMTITTTKNDYSGHAKVVTIDKSVDPAKTTVDVDEKVKNSNVSKYKEPEFFTKEVRTSFGTLQVTTAKTWFATVEKDIEANKPTSSTTDPVTIDFYTDTHSYYSTKTNKDIQYNIDIDQTTTITTTNKGFTVTKKTEELTVDDFVEFIKKYPKVEDNLKSAPSNIFYLLQQNENTQVHEKIMRYVMFKLNDVDYGVIELDFSIFNNFSRIGSGTTIFMDYLKSWENQAIWLYEKDECTYSSYVAKFITQDKTKYVCYNDSDKNGRN